MPAQRPRSALRRRVARKARSPCSRHGDVVAGDRRDPGSYIVGKTTVDLTVMKRCRRRATRATRPVSSSEVEEAGHLASRDRLGRPVRSLQAVDTLRRRRRTQVDE